MPHQCPVCQQAVTPNSNGPVVCSSCGAQVPLADCPFVEEAEPKTESETPKLKEESKGLFSFGNKKQEAVATPKKTKFIMACPVCSASVDENTPRDVQFRCASCGANISRNDCQQLEVDANEPTDVQAESATQRSPLSNFKAPASAAPISSTGQPAARQPKARPQQLTSAPTSTRNTSTPKPQVGWSCPVCKQAVTPTLPEPFPCGSCGAQIHKSDCIQNEQSTANVASTQATPTNPNQRSASPSVGVTPRPGTTPNNPTSTAVPQTIESLKKKTAAQDTTVDSWLWGPLNGMLAGVISIGMSLTWLGFSFLAGSPSLVPVLVLVVGVYCLVRGIIVTNSRVQEGGNVSRSILEMT